MEQKYEVDNLKEEQLEEWLDHVTTVFTTTSRKYFKDHMQCDPDRDNKGMNFVSTNNIAIWIAFDPKTKKIVSTVKIFKRNLIWQQKIISMGGIGEVSTQIEHRGQGLAKILLKVPLSEVNAPEMYRIHAK
jgi:predicted acetyltransferase